MKNQDDAKSSANVFGNDVFGATPKPAYQSQSSLGMEWILRSKHVV